jgi:hypothetical protein
MNFKIEKLQTLHISNKKKTKKPKIKIQNVDIFKYYIFYSLYIKLFIMVVIEV